MSEEYRYPIRSRPLPPSAAEVALPDLERRLSFLEQITNKQEDRIAQLEERVAHLIDAAVQSLEQHLTRPGYRNPDIDRTIEELKSLKP